MTAATDEVIVFQGPLPDRLLDPVAPVAAELPAAAEPPAVAPVRAAPSRQRFIAALVHGPVWLAAHGFWYLFVAAAIGELIGLVTAGSAIKHGFAGQSAGPGLLLLGIGVILLLRAAFAALAAHPRLLQLEARAGDPNVVRQRTTFGAVALALAYFLTLWRFLGPAIWQPLATFPAPAALAPAVAKAIDAAVKWAIVSFGAFFEAIRFCVFWLLTGIEAAFVVTPWPVTVMFLSSSPGAPAGSPSCSSPPHRSPISGCSASGRRACRPWRWSPHR